MSIQDTIRIIKETKEDELYEKALRIFEAIELQEHEKWSNVDCPRRQEKYVSWEEMLFRFAHGNWIVRCFICPKCKCERTIGAFFHDRDGLLEAAMLEECCFYCNSDKFESLIIDIIQENIPNEN